MPDSGREARLTAIWYGAARPPLVLRALARLYGCMLALRAMLYARGVLRTTRVPVPVVVVGNISVGGTGKSPLTAWLVARLLAHGRKPGIASRGYGRRDAAVRLVTEDDDPALVGDEPLMLRRETGVPVCVASARADAAQRLVAAGCDIVVCDDGLQHHALARDFEFAVVDGARGLGNGRLLPAGPLREDAARLGQVDTVVINGAGPGPAGHSRSLLHMQLVPADLRAVAGSGREPLGWLQGRAVHAVTGIGNPQRFFGLLRQLGARVTEHALPDHHRFTAGDIEFADALPVLMTAKDAVKCSRLAGPRHWYLPVNASFAPAEEQRLLERILALAGTEGRLRD